MELGSILLIFALLIIVIWFISRPLLDPGKVVSHSENNQKEHERSYLLAERDRVMNALKELDFDHSLGKIPEEEYPHQRSLLMKRGVEVIQRIDFIEATPSSNEIDYIFKEDLAERRTEFKKIETDQLQTLTNNGRKRVEAVSKVTNPNDDLEVMLANRRRERLEKASGFCPKCGGPTQISDRYCPKCGADLH